MLKNDEFQIKITGISSEGLGVGRYDGMAVFVPGVAEGETVTVHIIKVQKKYAVAKLISVDAPSADRISSDCPLSISCGGCAYRHISYEAESGVKEQRVRDAFLRIGGLSVDVRPIFSDGVLNGYRNKAQYPVSISEDGTPIFGFYAPHTHRVVPCEHCLLQPDSFSSVLSAFGEWMTENGISVYDGVTGKGILRHIYLRRAETTGEIMAVAVINADTLPAEKELVNKLCSADRNIVSIQYNINKKDTNVILGDTCKVVFGKGYITDEICGVKVRLSPLSFYQVNRNMAEKLYAKAAELACPEGKTVIDLYCGVGTIGLSMAKSAKKLIGVEIVPQAVEDAKINAAENGINNAEFICADAATAARDLASRGIRSDVVILDPPRKGCSPELISTVADDFSPERVVYVSCDPATLARDCKIFAEHGYRVSEAFPFDLFPRTVHVETVALLGRKQVKYRVEFDVDVTDLKKPTRKRATYPEIKEYVKERFGLNVSSLNIAQVKDKCGLGKRENYYKGKDGHRVPNCPEEKEKAIIETFKHFGMV